MSEGDCDRVVSTGLDWSCGYEYEVKVPAVMIRKQATL